MGDNNTIDDNYKKLLREFNQLKDAIDKALECPNILNVSNDPKYDLAKEIIARVKAAREGKPIHPHDVPNYKKYH